MDVIPPTFWTTAVKDGAIVVVALWLTFKLSNAMEQIPSALRDLKTAVETNSDLIRDFIQEARNRGK